MRVAPGFRIMVWVGLAFAGGTGPLLAQPAVAPGSRAAGLAGAFVAVADDATAVYWNPAGLGTGDFFSLVAGHTRSSTGDEAGLRQQRGNTYEALIGTPPLGGGYYRLGVSTAERNPDARPGERTASHLVTHNAAVAVAQSIGEVLNVGATVRVVHGQAVHATFFRGSADEVLDQIGDFQTTGTTTVDVDAGAMLRFDSMRIGLAVRNLAAPTFESLGGPPVTLDRDVRLGAAFFPARGLTVAVDAGLTRTDGPSPWRDLAAGVEQQVASRVVLRGGVRASTTGAARPSAAAGVSVALTPLLHVDVHAARGGADAPRGWGVSLRARY